LPVCWLKIGRADEHIKAIEAELLARSETELYLSSKERDAYGHKRAKR
jgi:hypothetical protein